jgi:hypothetical protein
MDWMVASGTIARQFFCGHTDFVLELINHFCGGSEVKVVKSAGLKLKAWKISRCIVA